MRSEATSKNKVAHDGKRGWSFSSGVSLTLCQNPPGETDASESVDCERLRLRGEGMEITRGEGTCEERISFTHELGDFLSSEPPGPSGVSAGVSVSSKLKRSSSMGVLTGVLGGRSKVVGRASSRSSPAESESEEVESIEGWALREGEEELVWRLRECEEEREERAEGEVRLRLRLRLREVGRLGSAAFVFESLLMMAEERSKAKS